MNSAPQITSIHRFIALDIHKHYVMVGGQNRSREWTLRPRRVPMVRFREWAEKNLQPEDAVVLETTGSVWDLYDIVAPLVGKAVIGDIGRFGHPKKLVGYAGLGAGVHASGEKYQEKAITKAGRKELRWALVEAAWVAVRSDPHWKAQFQRLQKRRHPNQAIVAIARRLLVALWHILAKREPYRHFDAERIAYKLLSWSWSLDEPARQGLTRPQFAKYGLLRLGIGQDLERIERGGYSRRLAPAEEVRALKPELTPPR